MPHELREKLANAAYEIGDEILEFQARERCLDKIVVRLAKHTDLDTILKNFLKGYPNNNIIYQSIIKYKDMPDAIESTLFVIGFALYHQTNPNRVKEIAKSLNQEAVYNIVKWYDGRKRHDLLFGLGNIAAVTGDTKLVGKIAKASKRKVKDKWGSVIVRELGFAYTEGKVDKMKECYAKLGMDNINL